MKLISKIVGVTLGLALAAGVSVGVAANRKADKVHAVSQSGNTVTFVASDFSGQGTANTGSACSLTEYGITISCSKGYGTSEFRVYSGSSFSISSSVGNITSLAFTFSGGKTGGLDASYSNVNSDTWSQASLGSQARFSEISVTYSSGGTPVDSVTINLDKSTLNLDINGSATGSLTATAVVSGNATAGLTAASSDPSVASITNFAPTSGEPFTITAEGEGTAQITVTSSWNPEVSQSCTINVVDTTPVLVNFKKVNSLSAGQRVLITTVADGNYYYLPSTTNTSSNPTAQSCTYNSTTQHIENVDLNMTFYVASSSTNWKFTNSESKYLYIFNNNSGIRIGDTEDSFIVETQTNGFSMKDANNNRYVGKYKDGNDWRSYTSIEGANYKGTDNEYNSKWINFWVEVKPTQTITGSSSAYSDSSVQLSSNAISPTWSIVAADTTAAGAEVSNSGLVTVTGPGVVKVKAVHNDFEDAYFVITFTERPAGTHSVTFNLNYAGAPAANMVEVNHNDTVAEPSEPTRPSTENYKYSFDGWYLNQEGTGDAYEFSAPVTDDLVLYAKWIETAKTVQEKIEEKKTTSSLLYNYGYANGDYDRLNREFTGVTNGSSSYADWSETGSSGAVFAGKSAGQNDSIQLRTRDSNEGIVITAPNSGSYFVKKITLVWNQATQSGRTVNVYGKDTAYSAPTDLFNDDEDVQGTLIGSSSYDGSVTTTYINIDAMYEFEYIGIKSNEGALYLSSIEVQWGNPSLEVSNVGIRFGGFLSKALWDGLTQVEGYGVMLAATDDLNGARLSASNAQYDKFVSNKPNPSEANESQKEAMGVNPTDPYYVWSLRVNIADGSYKTSITAVAYIKTQAGYIYLQSEAWSVKDLATDYLDNRGYSDGDFDGTLRYFADL